MNPGLRYLLRKKPTGFLRNVTRRAKGTKGLLLMLGLLVFAALVIGPQFFMMTQVNAEVIAARADSFRLWGSPALMLMALFGMTSGVGLYFKPSEIDFLFAAPVKRRDLLLYHVIGKLSVVLLSSLWLAIFVLRWAPTWYGGLVGIFFALSFMQLATQIASLALSTFSAGVTKRIRRSIQFGLLGLCGLGIWLTRQQMGAETTVREATRELAASKGVAVVATPARVFVEVFASETLGSFAAWGAGASAILVVLFVLITVLDVAYTETAIRASQQVQERLRRMRSGGGASVSPSSKALRLSLPALPWLGGAGPIAWRQGMEALRNVRGIAMMTLMTVGFPTVIVATSSSGSADKDVTSGTIGFVMILMMTMFTTPQLALDFRRDLDRMGYLKSLPLHSAAVAFGQVLPAAIIITLIQAVACAVLVLGFGVTLPCPWPMLLLLVPFNWLSMALDNVLFLLFPYRFAPKEAGNVQFMGRAMLSMTAKLLALMVAVGVAFALGWGLYEIGGESLVLGGLAATVVLLVAATGVTFLLGRVFGSFDSKDVPA